MYEALCLILSSQKTSRSKVKPGVVFTFRKLKLEDWHKLKAHKEILIQAGPQCEAGSKHKTKK